MGFNSKSVKKDDVAFMSEVDAAIHNKGSSFAYILSLVICLMVVVLVYWADKAVLDEVTRGVGQVIPSQHVQVIQNLEGGILKDILVRENQNVEKGDVLVRLDNTVAESIYREAYSKTLEHEAALIRLMAEIEGEDPVFTERLLAEAPQVCKDQEAIYLSKVNQLNEEIGVLKASYEQRQLEIKELSGKDRQLSESLKLAVEQLDIATPLVKKGIYPKVEYIALKRDVTRIRGEKSALKLSVPRLKKAILEAKNRIAQRRAEQKSAAFAEISKRRTDLKALQETLSAGEDRVTRTDVRSPVRGIVKQIIINTIGGVVKPGDSIMEIIPRDDTLLIEAKVRPADIAFLHPGQKAQVKITAYDYSIYGGMEGFVEQISVDSIAGERGETFYKVKLRTRTNSILYHGNRLPIIPGMTASIDVLTGKKSVLDYLLKPILKTKQNALRER